MPRFVGLFTPDGQRIVRKFDKSSLVRDLFSFVKSQNITGGKKFDLSFSRTSLIACLGSTLQESDLLNGAVMVEFAE